jgi:hypothetical protein
VRPSATPADTSAEAAELVVEAWRTMTVASRVALLRKMHEDVEVMAITGIRMQHPGIGDAELRFELFRRRYGDELASEVRDQILG